MIEVPQQLIANLLAEIEGVSTGLVQSVEHFRPNHRFGASKEKHQQELAATAPYWGHRLGLPESEILALSVIFRSHDLGRHVEALIDADTSRTSKRHGYESAQILESLAAWKDLPADLQYVITNAVVWHAEKDVPEPTSEATEAEILAYKLCYLLRDLDKEDLLGDPSFTTHAGINSQLNAHYKDRNRDEILNKGIAEDVMIRFKNCQLLTLGDIRASYATYMLVQLATIFDIRLPEVLGMITDNPNKYIQPRLDFIRSRVSAEQFEEIIQTLDGYLGIHVPSAGIEPASNL